MKDKLAWYSIAPHLTNLRFLGIFQLDPSSTPRHIYRLHQVYMRISISLQVLYATLQICYVYQVRNDTDKVMDSLFLLLSFLTCFYKMTIFWLNSDGYEELLSIMKGPLLNQDDARHKAILGAWARKARVILRVFNTLTLATCLLWTVFPLVSYLKGHYVDFAIWLPFDSNHHSYFYFVLIYQWLQTTWLGYNGSTMDSFQSFSYAQCAIQLSILRLDLETVVERSKKKALREKIKFTDAFHELFKVSLLHYDEIVKLANNVENVISGSVFSQFVATAWIFCTSTYRTVNMCPYSVEFFSMIFYMCCVLVEVFMYCYYGNEVTNESEKVINSAYSMNWLETPVKHRRSLIIFMERIKKPIQPMAGIIVPLSLSTFVSILRSSYSFYAFLKTTN